MNGGKSILVPLFGADMAADRSRSPIIHRPHSLRGPEPKCKIQPGRSPLSARLLQRADTLPRTVKERFEEIIQRQGAVKLLKGAASPKR